MLPRTNVHPRLAPEELELRPARTSPSLPEWLRDFYPFQTCMISVDGERMSVLDEGRSDAPPVVLLHGDPAWSFLFRNLVPQLSTRFRVVAPDMIGFGLSSKPADPRYHTLDQHIANFTTAMETLALKKVTLLLHGSGGPIGLAYAAKHPDNIARIVLLNTRGILARQSRKLRLPLAVRVAHTRLGEWLEPMLHLAVTSRLSFGTVRPLADLVIEGYKYPFWNGPRTAIHPFQRMLLEPQEADAARLEELGASLHNIKAPVSILWGARDPFLTKLPAYLLRDALKNAAEPIFLPQAAHFVPEDAPDAVLAAILNEKKPAGRADPPLKVLKS
jgi:haloalkane dehalogenase